MRKVVNEKVGEIRARLRNRTIRNETKTIGNRSHVATPFSELNKRLKGGLREGEFGVLMVHPGIGKSNTLLQFSLTGAANLLFTKKGSIAYHFLLEMSLEDIEESYVSCKSVGVRRTRHRWLYWIHLSLTIQCMDWWILGGERRESWAYSDRLCRSLTDVIDKAMSMDQTQQTNGIYGP